MNTDDEPRLLEPEQKVWGSTTCLISNAFMSIHLLKTKAGTCCSIHKHEHRTNVFIVASGSIVVRSFDADQRPIEAFTLRANHSLEVPPGVYHRFEVVEDAVVIEAYYAAACDVGDIQRLNVGGLIESLSSEPKQE